jgi:hypothetical protein
MNQEEQNFWLEVERLVVQHKPLTIEYRLYYNTDGEIVHGTMDGTDSGMGIDFLTVTQTEYENYFDYLVVNKRLVKKTVDAGYRVRLKQSTAGFPVVAGHAGLIIEPQEKYSDIEYYDRNN